MRRVFNGIFAGIAALLLAFSMISCSSLFDSDETTGSVSFSLSNEDLKSIIGSTQSARSITQGGEENKDLVLKLAVYSYDFKTFKSGELYYSYQEIEANVKKEITLDRIPVGRYALVALLYFDDSWTAKNNDGNVVSMVSRQPLYCGAEESIYVRGGTQTVGVSMIDFRGGFIEDYEPDYSEIAYYDFNLYFESAVAKSVEEDSNFGQYCIVASEDKPFYALLTENYGLISIGLVEGSTKNNSFIIRELATTGSDISSFDFLSDTNLITVYVEKNNSQENLVYYKINFHGKSLEFEGIAEEEDDNSSGAGGQGQYYMKVSFVDPNLTVPAGSTYSVTFTTIRIPESANQISLVKSVLESFGYSSVSDLVMNSSYNCGDYQNDKAVTTFSILTDQIIAAVSTEVAQNEGDAGAKLFSAVIAVGKLVGCLEVDNYKIIITTSDGTKYISGDQNKLQFNFNGDTYVNTQYEELGI